MQNVFWTVFSWKNTITVEIQTKYEDHSCHLTFWSLFCSTHKVFLPVCVALWSHCALSTSVLLLCRVHIHTVPSLQTLALSSSLAKHVRPCQPLNTLSWSFWHLTVSRTLPPAGRAPLQGRRIPLLRVCVALGGLESVCKAPWMMFGFSHSIILLPYWSGVEWTWNEFMGLKLEALFFFCFFSPREEENPRIHIGQGSRSWWGVNCMLPTWYFTHLTECTFMSPYFIPCVRVIWNPLTWISHLNLSSEPGMACRDKSLHTFRPRWFPYISDFTVSQDPLDLTLVYDRGFWLRWEKKIWNEDLCWAGRVTDHPNQLWTPKKRDFYRISIGLSQLAC